MRKVTASIIFALIAMLTMAGCLANVDDVSVEDEAFDIAGYWYYVKSMRIVDGEPHFFDSGGDTYHLIFREDGATFIQLTYPMIGETVRTGQYSFILNVHLEFVEEYRRMIPVEGDGIMLEYNPETGFLQYGNMLFERFVMPNIQIQVATDEILSQFDTFHAFAEFNEPGYQKMIITTDTVLWDFSLISGRRVFSVDYLSPEIPFVFTWREGRLFIRFRNNNQKFFDRTFYTFTVLHDECNDIYYLNERFWEGR